MKKAVFAFLFLLAIAVPAFATGDLKKVITGKVTDKESHETLAGVKVSVEGTSISTYTDMNGNYTLFIPQDGTTKISFSLVSYSNEVLSVPAVLSSGEIALDPAK